MTTPGGRYDFDDGGSYCGGWEDGKAHGFGVCTGPKGQGEYSGAWANGFEASGVYLWPSGNTFEGQWQQGKRHGLGVEKKDKWTYQGEWTQGFKGRYGVRQSNTSGAKYEGTWANGLQDGYGCESYADGGTYQGQWQRGTRHGYGVRQSVPYGVAAHAQVGKAMRSSEQSLQHSDEEEQDKAVEARDRKLNQTRGGFILTAKSDPSSQSTTLPSQQRSGSGSRLMSLFEKPARSMRRSLKAAGQRLRKQRSANDVSENLSLRSGKLSSSMRSTRSFASQQSTASSVASNSASKASLLDDERSFFSQDDIADVGVTERYCGEWSSDKRCGFGVSERSDGLRYEGEWYNNKKHGYGTTTHKDGSREDGKYKNNVLVSSTTTAKARLLIMQRNKLAERVAASVEAARRAAQLAVQKAEVAVSRMASARSKAELAMAAAEKGQQDSVKARAIASQLDPKFHQPGLALLRKKQQDGNGGGGFVAATGHDLLRARGAAVGVGPTRHSTAQTGGADVNRPNGLVSGSTAATYESALPRSATPGGRTSSPSSPEANLTHGFWHDQQLQSVQQTATIGKLNDSANRAILVDHFDHYETLARGVAPSTSEQHVHHRRHRSPLSALSEQHEQQRGGVVGNINTNGSGTDRIKAEIVTPAMSPALQSQQLPAVLSGPGLPRPQSGGDGVSFSLDGSAAGQARTYTGRLLASADFSRAGGSGTTAPPALFHRSKDDASLLRSKGYALKSSGLQGGSNGAQEGVATTALTSATTEEGTSADGSALSKSGGGTSTLGSSRKQRGSLPDVSIIRDMSALSKAEVQKLSSERREEIRKLLQENERRRQGDVSILLADLKTWLDQRKLIMFVLAFNLGLISILLSWWL